MKHRFYQGKMEGLYCQHRRERGLKKGIWYAIGAYCAWGLFPIYWKWLHKVPALELIAHRIAWSFILLAVIIFITRQWKLFHSTLTRKVFLIYLAAAVLLSINWLTYVWAVNAGFIVETSLGYFINPLLSVLMGVIFLRERLRTWQWVPIGLAAAGVLYLTFAYGALPWIALTLAFSFGIYGLVKKTAPLGSLYGLTLETSILFIPAVGFLVYLQTIHQGAFLNSNAVTDLLLAGAGLVTTLPLLMFASAAQRIPLSLVGVLQYIAPTLQFLIGVLVYKELFDQSRLIGFGTVWLALILFWGEGLLARRARVSAVGGGNAA
jgi:chloramphenicol-sensitive protein RarD